MNIGKMYANPPNDIIFGGRDMFIHHAVVRTSQDGNVYVRPLHKGAHLYINGKKV